MTPAHGSSFAPRVTRKKEQASSSARGKSALRLPTITSQQAPSRMIGQRHPSRPVGRHLDPHETAVPATRFGDQYPPG